MTIDSYIIKFSKLSQDKIPSRWGPLTNRRAPHKPLLLLAVLDQFAEGTIQTNHLDLSPDLGELFTLYWARVMPPDQRGNISLPFFHLKTSGFWHLLPKPGKADYLASAGQIKSFSALQNTILGVRLDEDLYALLRIEESREVLRRVLIETYFSSEAQTALVNQSSVNQEAYQYSETLLKQAKDKIVKESLFDVDEYRPARDQGFRRAIISAYDHYCAFCGLKVLTPDGHTAADAAHIVPWSKTHNDAVDNGMALCKLCHWGFDEGLLTASAQYIVVVSDLVRAAYNVPGHLPEMAGRSLTLPKEEAFWPSREGLKTHRADIYRGR